MERNLHPETETGLADEEKVPSGPIATPDVPQVENPQEQENESEDDDGQASFTTPRTQQGYERS